MTKTERSSAIDVVRAFLSAVSAGDVEGAVELLDRGVEWRPQLGAALGGATVYRGHDGFRRYYSDVRDVLDDFSVEVLSFELRAPWLVTEIRIKGRGKATGMRLTADFVQIWKVRKGKVLVAQTFDDAAAAAATISGDSGWHT